MKFIFTFIAPLFLYFQVCSQNRFQTYYGIALSAEAGGISPFVSANFEFVPYRTKTTFYTIRAGAGFISNGSQGVSIPVAVTYNVWLKSKKNCDAAPQRYTRESFAEVGFGASYVSFLGQEPIYYFAPIVGIRKHLMKWGTSNVFFYKLNLTPIYSSQSFRLGAGFSLGHSL